MTRRGSLAIALACLCAAAAFAQADPSAPFPEREDRLIGLARVWAKVKVFHPYLGYRDIDWDGALVAAIPKVEAATTQSAYRDAVDAMLRTLGDPITHIGSDAPPAGAGSGALPPLTTVTSGVLVVSAAALAEGRDPAAIQQRAAVAREAIARASSLVIDLTGAPDASRAAGAVELLRDALPAVDAWPLQRVVQHEGFRSQGNPVDFYSSSFVTVGAHPSTAGAKTGPAHVVFVVRTTGGLPEIVYGLQASGRGSIVSDGPLDEDVIALTTDVELPGGGRAHLRTGELEDGPPAPDVIAPARDLLARAIALAKTRTSAAAGKVVPRRAAHALPPYRAHDDADAPATGLPAREVRLLAGIRLWMTLEYFWPYRDLITDWDGALRDALPALGAAASEEDYVHALQELAARSDDGHVSVYSTAPDAAPTLAPPFEAWLVEGQLVVTRILDDSAARAAGIAVGDVIGTIDGVPVRTALWERERRIAGATIEGRDQMAARSLLRGKSPSVLLDVRGADGVLREISVARTAAAMAATWRPAPGPHWQKLPGDIGYADLSALQFDEVGAMFADLADTRALIFDMRGYPNGTAWPIAPRINTRGASVVAQFEKPLVRSDERLSIHFTQAMPQATPGVPIYPGKIVVLIDHRAISQAEHTCMFFEAAAGATFVGSPTQGTNGDVTVARLPGGLRMSFTGEEPRHADGRKLQRIGIQPNLLVRPTIAGLRAGRDEVLDRALESLGGINRGD